MVLISAASVGTDVFAGSAVAVFAGSAVAVFSGSAVAVFVGSVVAVFSGSAVAVFIGSAVAVFSGSAVTVFAGSALCSAVGVPVNAPLDSAGAGVPASSMQRMSSTLAQTLPSSFRVPPAPLKGPFRPRFYMQKTARAGLNSPRSRFPKMPKKGKLILID